LRKKNKKINFKSVSKWPVYMARKKKILLLIYLDEWAQKCKLV